MNKNNLACIIVSFNIGEDIYKCYNSIKNQVDKVIIVDNGSDEITVKCLNKINSLENTKVIFLNSNQGIATALNEGVRLALELGYEWVLTMDNDSKAQENMVKNMMLTYNNINKDERDNIKSIAPIYIKEGTDCEVETDEKYKYVDLAITSGNIVNLSIFKEIGFFRDDYFIDYVDNEFCLRIIKNKKKIIQVNSAILEHNLGNDIEKKFLGKVIKSTNHSALRRYYLTRNALDVRENFKSLNIRHIKNTKRVLLKFIIQILLVEKNKLKKINFMYKGYKDFKKQKFGELKL
ncbi:MAG: glycosyltransferase family 2 protein [Sarcina sp.]